MRKILLFVVVAFMFTSFQASTWSNKNKYFFKTDYITKVDGKYEFEIKKLFVEKPPKFYEPDLYMEKGELTLQEEFTLDEPGSYTCKPAVYGWMVAKSGKNLEYQFPNNIILDATKPHNNELPMEVVDVSNSLFYGLFKDGTLKCIKVSQDSLEESWNLKLPFVPRLMNIKWVFGSKIVIYGYTSENERILVVDTEKVEVVAEYRLSSEDPITMLFSKNERLWVVRFTMFDFRQKDYKIYVIDLNANEILAFLPEKFFDGLMAQNDGIVIRDKQGFYAVDGALCSLKTELANINKDAIMEKNGDDFGVNRNRFIFKIGDKKFVFDKNNPCALREIPSNLEEINTESIYLTGYVFHEGSYWYGYDLENYEKTWRIKTDKMPDYSSESGVIFAKPDRLLLYGVDKNKPAK